MNYLIGGVIGAALIFGVLLLAIRTPQHDNSRRRKRENIDQADDLQWVARTQEKEDRDGLDDGI